jgi:cobalamin biosynthesis protein CobD/CbiB
MSESEVVDPAGNRWVVRRRWTPRWARVDVGKRFRKFHRRGTKAPKQRRKRWWDNIDGDIPLDFDGIVVVLALIVALLILWFAVIPLLLVLFDVLIVIVLFLVGLATRVLLRRPWTVVATRHDGAEIQREVVGWRASRDEIAALRHEIERGFAEAVPGAEPP